MKEKQIEEMAKVLCGEYNPNCYKDCCCSHDCNVEYDCRTLYNAGYRKQSEGEWEWYTELHGNPIDGMDEDFGYRCSNCKVWASEFGVDGDIYEEPPTNILPFCPNCGARMKGESK
jgi:hypothetical protein